jgi:hypothetical protein
MGDRLHRRQSYGLHDDQLLAAQLTIPEDPVTERPSVSGAMDGRVGFGQVRVGDLTTQALRVSRRR